jgi:dTMP kinase
VGGVGAGKSTQARRLSAALAEAGIPVLCTREPGGSPGAEALRGLLLSRPWDALAEMALHFAARREHWARSIAPALEAGVWVVCDRFFDSTLAYQANRYEALGAGFHARVRAAFLAQAAAEPGRFAVLDAAAPEAAVTAAALSACRARLGAP